MVREEALPVLCALLAGLADGNRAVRLPGVTVSGLLSSQEAQRARQLVAPSPWQEEREQGEAERRRNILKSALEEPTPAKSAVIKHTPGQSDVFGERTRQKSDNARAKLSNPQK